MPGSLGTGHTKRVVIDYNTPVDGLDTPAAFRIDGMAHVPAWRDATRWEHKRYGIAPAWRWVWGTPTRITVSYFHPAGRRPARLWNSMVFSASRRLSPATLITGYGAPTISRRCGFHHRKAEHEFRRLHLREQLRYADYTRSERHIPRRWNPAGITTATPLSGHQRQCEFLYRLQPRNRARESKPIFLTKFDTGAVTHDLVAGLEFDDETSDPTYINSAAQQKSLLTPKRGPAFQPGPDLSAVKGADAYQHLWHFMPWIR